MRKRASWMGPILVAGSLAAMGCAPADPLDDLVAELDSYPVYSVILEDMRTEGNFFTDYYHQYKVVTGEKEDGSEDLVFRDRILDWQGVSEETYRRYEPHLGMVLVSKDDEGEVATTPQPPGYRYVGDSRYGRWRRDGSGGSFWEFYGKYALLSHVFGTAGNPVYRRDWDSYRDHRSRGRPYFGPNREYGTKGSYTKKTHRDFFERQKARQAQARQRFSRKVQNRSRMSSTRSRGFGFGK